MEGGGSGEGKGGETAGRREDAVHVGAPPSMVISEIGRGGGGILGEAVDAAEGGDGATLVPHKALIEEEGVAEVGRGGEGGDGAEETRGGRCDLVRFPCLSVGEATSGRRRSGAPPTPRVSLGGCKEEKGTEEGCVEGIGVFKRCGWLFVFPNEVFLGGEAEEGVAADDLNQGMLGSREPGG